MCKNKWKGIPTATEVGRPAPLVGKSFTRVGTRLRAARDDKIRPGRRLLQAAAPQPHVRVLAARNGRRRRIARLCEPKRKPHIRLSRAHPHVAECEILDHTPFARGCAVHLDGVISSRRVRLEEDFPRIVGRRDAGEALGRAAVRRIQPQRQRGAARRGRAAVQRGARVSLEHAAAAQTRREAEFLPAR